MMQDFGGLESFTPGEGTSNASEQLSEEAKQRFAQAQQQIKQIAREEKKAKKRDDRVAATIRQFMENEKYAHLFPLVSRLAAFDCPSVFILAILSLIHQESLEAVEEYIREHGVVIQTPDMQSLAFGEQNKLSPAIQEKLIAWSSRLELVMNIDAEKVLTSLMVDEGNIDGSVLQITTFVLVDFFNGVSHPVPYEKLQPLTVKILQDIVEPHVEVMERHFAKKQKESTSKDED